MSERMDQFSDILRLVLEFTQNNGHQESPHEHRLLGHDDRLNVPKWIRLEFPHFDGNNPASWVFKANHFFEFHQIPNNQKLLMVSFHMEGKALLWYQNTLDSCQFFGWESFVKALQVRFRPSTYNDPIEALTRLKQTSYVTSYNAQFQTLWIDWKGCRKDTN